MRDGRPFHLGTRIWRPAPGLRPIVLVIDVLRRVSLCIVTMPIQSQGIIPRDNVSMDLSAVAYLKVVDAVKSVIAIENVGAAINQIAQTALRKVVGQHTLDETLAETDKINQSIREILDVATADWGLLATLVELKDIQLPVPKSGRPLPGQPRPELGSSERRMTATPHGAHSRGRTVELDILRPQAIGGGPARFDCR